MPKFTGQCLCGAVSYEADGEPFVQANCHCLDCRQSSGSAFATLVFMKDDEIVIAGELKNYSHQVDSGNMLTKQFCPTCGSQLFGLNSARPSSIAIKAGTINEQEHVKPQVNVFAGSKMDCTLLDPSVSAFDKMPG